MKDKLICKGIIQDLLASVNGLREFQITYADDILIFGQVEALIENIGRFIIEIKSHRNVLSSKDLVEYIDKNTIRKYPPEEPNK